jgi:hypothetical protein
MELNKFVPSWAVRFSNPHWSVNQYTYLLGFACNRVRISGNFPQLEQIFSPFTFVQYQPCTTVNRSFTRQCFHRTLPAKYFIGFLVKCRVQILCRWIVSVLKIVSVLTLHFIKGQAVFLRIWRTGNRSKQSTLSIRSRNMRRLIVCDGPTIRCRQAWADEFPPFWSEGKQEQH